MKIATSGFVNTMAAIKHAVIMTCESVTSVVNSIKNIIPSSGDREPVRHGRESGFREMGPRRSMRRRGTLPTFTNDTFRPEAEKFQGIRPLGPNSSDIATAQAEGERLCSCGRCTDHVDPNTQESRLPERIDPSRDERMRWVLPDNIAPAQPIPHTQPHTHTMTDDPKVHYFTPPPRNRSSDRGSTEGRSPSAAHRVFETNPALLGRYFRSTSDSSLKKPTSRSLLHTATSSSYVRLGDYGESTE